MKASLIIAICMLLSGCIRIHEYRAIERAISDDSGNAVYQIDASASEKKAVSMTIYPEAVSLPLTDDYTALLTIRNTTDTIYACGTDYEIEVYQNHKWTHPLTKTQAEFAWHALRINIRPSETKSFNVRFFTSVYDYEPGLYRIKKDVMNTKTKQSVTLYALFKIQ